MADVLESVLNVTDDCVQDTPPVWTDVSLPAPAKLRTPASSTRACTTTSPFESTVGAVVEAASLAIDATALWLDEAPDMAEPIFQGVVPLASLDGHPFPSRATGERLREAYRRETAATASG